MSRIMGDALVAGAPECVRGPEYVTVRMTRGQAMMMETAAKELAAILTADGHIDGAANLRGVLAVLSAQIGGAR